MVVMHSEHSTRASRDLAEHVVATVKRYRSEHPKTSDADVQTALAAATQHLSPGLSAPTVVRLVALVAAAMAVAGLVALGVNPRTRLPLQQAPWLIIGAVVLVVAAGVAFVAARSRE